MTNSETALWSSWFELQTEFAQQLHERSGEWARTVWNGAARDDSASAGTSAAALTPAAWFEQSQALQSMLHPWGAPAFGGD
jgi:hypothetical protein